MIMIYHCFGGAHSSVTAAALHLGLLHDPGSVSAPALEALPYFDKNDPRELGQVHLLGHIAPGEPVLAVGRTTQKTLLVQSLGGIARVYGGDDVLFADTSRCINWRMVVGGITSRRLQLRGWGRPWVVEGTVRAAPRLGRLVTQARRWAAKGEGVTAREQVTDELHYVPAGDRGQADAPAPQWGQRKVIYCCRDGVHCSAVVAALHAGRLPVGRHPTVAELEARFSARPPGALRYVGTGPGGQEVYTLGTGQHQALIKRAVNSFVRCSYPHHPAPLIIDARRLERGKTRLGLIIQNRWPQQGRRLLCQGILDDYPQYEAMARDITNLLIRPRLSTEPLAAPRA